MIRKHSASRALRISTVQRLTLPVALQGSGEGLQGAIGPSVEAEPCSIVSGIREAIVHVSNRHPCERTSGDQRLQASRPILDISALVELKISPMVSVSVV